MKTLYEGFGLVIVVVPGQDDLITASFPLRQTKVILKAESWISGHGDELL